MAVSIHQSAIVDVAAVLGADVSIGPFTVVEAGAEIGDGSVVGSHCVLGEPMADRAEDMSIPPRSLVFGEGARIRSHSVFYEGSSFGPRLETGHRVTVRERVRAGTNLRVGTLTDLQGDCTLGEYVRLHSNVFIGKDCSVGDFSWVFPYCVLTNDPHPPSDVLSGVSVGRFAVIATMSVLLPGVRVADDVLIAADSLVRSDVPAGRIFGGRPARDLGPTSAIRHRVSGHAVYPWRYTFDRGMPWEGVGFDHWQASQDA